jgi:hypothetical protein
MTASGQPDELEFREKEARRQWWGILIQAVASLGTVIVAAVVAFQGQQAYTSATHVSLQQAQDNQLSTALTSLGSSDVAERIAGLVLLEQNAEDRVAPDSIAVFGRQSAYNHYTDVLAILSGYIRTHGSDILTPVSQVGHRSARGMGRNLYRGSRSTPSTQSTSSSES